MGKLEHSVASRARELWVEKVKVLNIQTMGLALWKPAVLIGAPLNGKRFWTRAE